MRIAPFLVAATLLSAQQFEVASVKPANPEVRVPMNCQGGPGTPSAERFVCTNAPLKMLICLAYDVQFYRVISPDWTATLGYDIVAAVPAGTTRLQFRTMLKNLLADRMSLKLRSETRDLPAYSLVSAGKPKLLESGKATAPAVITGTRGDGYLLTARHQRLSALAGYLSVQLQTEVMDETMLSGDFDFQLQFAPPQASSGDRSSPSLFTALEEQLGLRLRAGKAPVGVFVLESASRIPIAN